jgi:hypothetical protein
VRAECIKQIVAFREQIQSYGSILNSQLCLISVWALQCIVLNANDHGEGEQISHYAICFLDTYSLSHTLSMSIAVLGFLKHFSFPYRWTKGIFSATAIVSSDFLEQ